MFQSVLCDIYVLSIIISAFYNYFIFYKPYTKEKGILSDIRFGVLSVLFLFIYSVSEINKDGVTFNFIISSVGALVCAFYLYRLTKEYKNIKNKV